MLLDVRDDWETALVRLDNAMHIPMDEIEFAGGRAGPARRDVVYCHHGVRSAAVADYLRSIGFKRVMNLAGRRRRVGAHGRPLDEALLMT